MPGGKRVAVRDRHERMRLRRPLLAHGSLDEARDPVGGEDDERDEDERARTATDDGDNETEHEPDEPVGADLRQPDEDLVQRMPAVVDDPPLELPVPAGQRDPC